MVKKKKTTHKNSSKKEGNKLKKAQAISVDLVIAVSIFLIIGLVFFAQLKYSENKSQDSTKINELNQVSLEIKNVLDHNINSNNDLYLIEDGKVKFDRFQAYYNGSVNYDQLKASLNVDKDFCIVFTDSLGNPVQINESGDVVESGGRIGFGSPTIVVMGCKCGEICN